MDVLIDGKQSKYNFNNLFLRFFNDFIRTDHFDDLVGFPHIRFGIYYFNNFGLMLCIDCQANIIYRGHYLIDS